jgi:hypothetical protein
VIHRIREFPKIYAKKIMIIFWYKNGSGYYLFQEGADLNPDPDCPIDNVYDDYQSMKSGIDPTSEIPRHEGLTNSPDSPTLADLLQQDDTGEKEVNICYYDLSFFFFHFSDCDSDRVDDL